jgi:hypothetical protein
MGFAQDAGAGVGPSLFGTAMEHDIQPSNRAGNAVERGGRGIL